MEEQTCPYCRRSIPIIKTKEDYFIVKCTDCGKFVIDSNNNEIFRKVNGRLKIISHLKRTEKKYD